MWSQVGSTNHTLVVGPERPAQGVNNLGERHVPTDYKRPLCRTSLVRQYQKTEPFWTAVSQETVMCCHGSGIDRAHITQRAPQNVILWQKTYRREPSIVLLLLLRHLCYLCSKLATLLRFKTSTQITTLLGFRDTTNHRHGATFKSLGSVYFGPNELTLSSAAK